MLILYAFAWILAMPLISDCSVLLKNNNATIIAKELLENMGPPTNRPVLDPKTVINVSLAFVLTQVIELSDMKQELTVSGWFNMKWKDEVISGSWNAEEYGVDCVFIPKDRIWKPDITLDNTVDEEFGHYLPSAPVQVCANGSATYATNAIFRSSCYISIEFFPYDNQTCDLRFSSWTYDASQLNIHPELRSSDQDRLFNDNGVWKLISVDGRREVEEFQSVSPFVYTVFEFHLLRRHKFQLLFLLIPYFCCSFVICLMYFIPIESGEKLSYGITAVLGMIVFQQIISFSLPPVGNETTLVGKYFTSVFCIGMISVFVEIIVNNIHMQGNLYKVSLYIIKRYQTKIKEAVKKKDDNNKTEEADERVPAPDSDTEHADKVKHYCSLFDFYMGLLCVCLLFILMLWFLIVIQYNVLQTTSQH